MPESTEFKELLSKAPMGPDENTLVLVGVLTRSSNPSKFGLYLSSGGSITLGIEAVLKHEVLNDSIGQTLVRVTLDAGKVPAETMPKVGGGSASPFVLQHGHHASPAIISAMDAFSANPNLSRTSPRFDYKDPPSDGTYPTPHGTHLDS